LSELQDEIDGNMYGPGTTKYVIGLKNIVPIRASYEPVVNGITGVKTIRCVDMVNFVEYDMA
jgi:hypothetical protein